MLSHARATAEPAGARHRVVPAGGSPRSTGFPQAAVPMGSASIKPSPNERRPAPPETQMPPVASPEVAAMAGTDPASEAPAQVPSPTVPPPGTYGRILIFTLLDDRVADFDRLAGQTAEEVRTREPDTLVYVTHLVPNMPLARIFYEIYRDRAAFDSHESQPHMQRFVADRRSCVLATNVIELTPKHAKIAPLANPQPTGTTPPPGAPTQLPKESPRTGPGTPRPEPVPPRPPPSVPPQGPQRLQSLPPARTQRPDQPQRPGPLPSAGRRNGGA